MRDTLYHSIRRILWAGGFKIGDFSYEFFEDFREEYESSPKHGSLYDMPKYFPKTLDNSLATNVEFMLYLQVIFEYLSEKGEDVKYLPPRSVVYQFLEPYESIVKYDPSLKGFRRKHRIRNTIKSFFNILVRLAIPLGICIELFEDRWFFTAMVILSSNLIYMGYLTHKNHTF